jgi:hypothetical protein
MIEHRFTTEGLIIIALAMVPVVLLSLEERRRRWPLKMVFDAQPYGGRTRRRFQRSATIHLGTCKLYVVLTPRAPINIQSLDIRLGYGLFWWHDAWSPQIRVTNVRVPQWEDQAQVEQDCARLLTKDNLDGGFIVSLRPPKLWTARDGLYVEVEIEAEAPWAGLLSVRCCGERRTYTRRRVTAVRGE